MEDPPDREVRTEVFELVLDACGYEREVTRIHALSFAQVHEDAVAAHDDVDLVLLVRRLPLRDSGIARATSSVARRSRETA